jgi:hypothetical protein
LYWGDLHVHTAFSFDAWLNDVRVSPADAYRFARGEPVDLPPLGPDGRGTQTVSIDRPLDFAAVTDHAEFIGEVTACSEPGSDGYDLPFCQEFRGAADEIMVQFGLRLNTDTPARFPDLCGDGIDCLAAAADAWTRIQAAAEQAYDRSEDCEFTSFVGYEWSGALELSNLHRNVIFKSEVVPDLPTSHFEAPRAHELWDTLHKECVEGRDGCDVLAIPHNSNWSNGKLFVAEYPEGRDEAEAAALRARMEPLMEVFQHKGDSECKNGFAGILGDVDEACDWEKLRRGPFDDCGDGVGSLGMVAQGCVSRVDFLRGVLLEGLQEQERIGVNPYRIGVMASTDTHNGTPGAVAEATYAGHFGAREMNADARLRGAIPAGPLNGPGGLIAVWAEHNDRASLFDAMVRRETYGTSGPRIAVRLFGGDDLPMDLCERGDLVEVGYDKGVPMGGELPEVSVGAKPRFVVQAMRDPGTAQAEGTPLQRAQIVKGWIDDAGERHIDVVDVAGGDNSATVDPTTCAPMDPLNEGADTLCAVWEDSTYEPGQDAFWYVRVLENPTCRWSTRDCTTWQNEHPGEEPPLACTDGIHAVEQRERAWTSAIWAR